MQAGTSHLVWGMRGITVGNWNKEFKKIKTVPEEPVKIFSGTTASSRWQMEAYKTSELGQVPLVLPKPLVLNKWLYYWLCKKSTIQAFL